MPGRFVGLSVAGRQRFDGISDIMIRKAFLERDARISEVFRWLCDRKMIVCVYIYERE